MYSHLSSNDQTGNLDFVDPAGWMRAATVAPFAGSYSAYGTEGSTPWIEIQTDAGPFRLNGVAWTLHAGSPPPDTASTSNLAVSPTAYISVAWADAVNSIFSHTHQSSFDNVHGNGTKPTVGEVFGKHPIDLLSDFAKERVDGTKFGDVIVLNDQGSQAFTNDGNDIVTGGGGDDEISGGNGDDTLSGGGGQDHLNGGNDNDRLYGGADSDEIHGDSGADIAYGGDGQDTIFGEAGKDSLFGGEDNDLLFGSTGRDTLYGGEGQDKLYGDAAKDKLYGDADNDELYGGESKDTLYGGIGQDKLYGDADSDRLYGDEDDDQLFGSTGDDILYGGIGQDFLNGDGGKDKLYGDADNDDLNGLGGKDKLFGGVGQDDLDGGSGKDKLKGGDDNDRLDGGSGKDVLTGGDGANQFVFSTGLAPKNVDRITDFKVGFDSIELSHTVFGALSPGALDKSEFHSGAHAKTANQHVIYNANSGVLTYDINGKAKGGAQVVAKFDGNPDLHYTDFLVI